MEWLEGAKELYAESGSWGDPILICTLGLMLVGSVMLFFVRVVKRFVLYSIVALVLPNSIGFVGYLDEANSLKEAVVERGETMADELKDAVEDREWSILSFGLLGSALAVSLGVVGLVRLKFRRQQE